MSNKQRKNRAIRGSKEYYLWRERVKNRDGRKCVLCDTKKRLEVHHKKHFCEYPDLRTDISNGITLCHYCHKKIHRV